MKRTICLIISAVMILSSLTFFTAAADKSGAIFAVDEFYRSSKVLSKHPHTFEAWIKVEKGAAASELGAIAGNYKDSKNPATASRSARTVIPSSGSATAATAPTCAFPLTR